MKDKIKELIYKTPKCDFEHIWNCAINKALELFNKGSYEKHIEEENIDDLVIKFGHPIEGNPEEFLYEMVPEIEVDIETDRDWPFKEKN